MGNSAGRSRIRTDVCSEGEIAPGTGAIQILNQMDHVWGPRPDRILKMKTAKVTRVEVSVSVNVEKVVLYLLIGVLVLLGF
jgi:hypothetical protein